MNRTKSVAGALMALLSMSIAPSLAVTYTCHGVSRPSSESIEPTVQFTTANGGFQCVGILPQLDNGAAYTLFGGLGGVNFPGPATGGGNPKFTSGSQPTLDATGKNIRFHYYVNDTNAERATVLFNGNNMSIVAQPVSTGYYYGNSGSSTYIGRSNRGGAPIAIGVADDYHFDAGSWTGTGNSDFVNAKVEQLALAIYTTAGSANNPDLKHYTHIWFHMTPNNSASPCFLGTGATAGSTNPVPTLQFQTTGSPDTTFNYE